jgi:hypothetical protein
MVALAARHEMLSNDLPPVMPAESRYEWGTRRPVMRAFPRLAAERVEEPTVEAQWHEEPERWDGMA